MINMVLLARARSETLFMKRINIYASRLIAVLIFATAALSLNVPAHASDTKRLELHALESGDEIKVIVFGEDSLTGIKRISPEGTVSMPFIGEVPVSGLTVYEAQELIRTQLADGFLINPVVSVDIALKKPFYIMGEVRSPGEYPYKHEMTVLNAVALAGGFTHRAAREEVQIYKDGASDPAIQGVQAHINPGDVIVIEERFF